MNQHRRTACRIQKTRLKNMFYNLNANIQYTCKYIHLFNNFIILLFKTANPLRYSPSQAHRPRRQGTPH